MNKSILIIISYTYVFSIFLLLFTFKSELTLFILLQNSLLYLYISYLIFRCFINSGSEIFSLASKVTFMRLNISLMMLTAVIHSSMNLTIFDIFYSERMIVILGMIALLLDGLDGFIARKYDHVTKFGEKIDQESDNFLMLVLSISLYLNREIGAYIFLIPLYRYLFIFFMSKYDWLKTELPISQFRKFACAVTTLFMVVAQDVYFDPENTLFLVILSLFIITFSFAKDIIWLYRNKYEKA